MQIRIANIDPQGRIALMLLDEAAAEVRPLYGPASASPARPPINEALGDRDRYVAAFHGDMPIGCGALREFDAVTAEARRMYVRPEHRRQGVGRTLLLHLLADARSLGYRRIILETGNRQSAAAALYRQAGFKAVAPFGEHVSDPTSICYELPIAVNPAEPRF